MLSNTSTRYLVELCDKYPENKYVVVEWPELKSLWEYAPEDFDFDESWKELKMNECIVYKYKDEDEVCFTLTDKARVLVQEYKMFIEQTLASQQVSSSAQKSSSKKIDEQALTNEQREILKDTFVKTDSDGRTVMVMPKEAAEKKKRFEFKKIKQSAFAGGFVGGLISGLIFGIIFGIIGGIIGGMLG